MAKIRNLLGFWYRTHALFLIPYGAPGKTKRKKSHYNNREGSSVPCYSGKYVLIENVRGSLVCIYYPDFMDGINAAGWHFHFVSEDRKYGGHVFDLKIRNAELSYSKMSMLEIQLPKDPSFDTYALKEASQKDIKEVEQK